MRFGLVHCDGPVCWRWSNALVDGDLGDQQQPRRMIAVLRFIPGDGRDPRVEPREGETHLTRSGHYDAEGRCEASCGPKGPAVTDYGPITSVDCPSCAAMLAAMLLREQPDA